MNAADAVAATPATPNETDNARTVVHFVESLTELVSHAARHTDCAAAALQSGDAESVAFNIQHAQGHLDEIVEHTAAFVKFLSDIPEYDDELKAFAAIDSQMVNPRMARMADFDRAARFFNALIRGSE